MSRGVLARRLSVQRLAGAKMAMATDVVRLLTCVQSQEWAHGFWSLGMRTTGCTYADVQAEFDAGSFVRTHVLRPTWHYLAAEDLAWVQTLTAPRVQQQNRSQGRNLGLSADDLDLGLELIRSALVGGRQLTRRALSDVLVDGGISTEGQRLAYLVMNAELEGVICSGVLRGAQHTYALVSERIPPTPTRSREDALCELTWRFFSGHGPASVADFTRWCSLTRTDARAGLELVGDRLARVEHDGHELWFDPAGPEPAEQQGALLVPLYDEVTLTYPRINFPIAASHPHPPGSDLFVGSVLVDLVNVGTWRRTVRGSRVRVETALADGLGDDQRAAVAEEVLVLAAFLGRELERS